MLDQFDIRILAVLQERGDIGPVELSETVPLSASQCSRRLSHLRQAGYIEVVRGVLSAERLNIGIQAYVMLTMKSHSPETTEAFRQRLRQLDEVLEAHRLTGTADIILKVATHNLASFNRLLTLQILGAPEVATSQSSIILEQIKNTTAFPLRFQSTKG